MSNVTNKSRVLWKDKHDCIMEEDPPDTMTAGIHLGCNGIVDRFDSTYKTRTILLCRACKLRVIETDFLQEGEMGNERLVKRI